MLTIHIPSLDQAWDPYKEEFVTLEGRDLVLEHSLISISKWESNWCKPFFGSENDQKTNEELLDYIKCMTITQNVDEKLYDYIPESELIRIKEYMENDHTATTFSVKEDKKKGKKEDKHVLTSEEIYYFMIALNIPFECQRWHLGRLMTLIKVCNEKNKEEEDRVKNGGKKKPLTQSEQMDLAKKYDEINRRNREKYKSKG